MRVEGLAILGFVEGLTAYPFVLKKVQEAVAIIMAEDPRAVVLIDSWGLMVRIAKALKKQGYKGKIIKYVAPQVWAMRSGRAKVLARYIDHLLSTQPMDAPYFDAVGLPQSFVGNPVLDTDYGSGDAQAMRADLGIAPEETVIGLFPGSRPSEIERVAPAILAADDVLQSLTGGHRSICIVADNIRTEIDELLKGSQIMAVGQNRLLDVLPALSGAIACSGTITTQLAAAGVPTVVMYRLSPLTHAIAKRLMKPDHISLVNIAAGETLMPEYIQDAVDGPEPAKALFDMIRTDEQRVEIAKRLIQQTREMGAGGENASDKAARAVLDLLV
ncbi:lipid-A-disaccharide synthase [Algimonas porphyrae]|uniref:Lipid-A-disaccharide synthase n=2 Tax=Algimonas porphyrae TaxID=1128113 RepID=A0ABQ5UYC1_9PROT|nr:lipid-A-disaccharide synthase [Algimonas porphyrae]